MQSNDFVASYFEAWNRHDPERVADHLAPDGIYREVRQNAQRTHDELVDHLRSFFSQYRHRYELLGDILHNGRTVAFQYRMVPAGRRGAGRSSQGAEFITLAQDSATLIADYHDVPDAPARPRRTRQRRKYAKSGLCARRMQQYMSQLDELMQEEQVYLDPALTLPALAERVGCSVNHLSQVLNAGFGLGFFDYVNRYRVQRAQRLLDEVDDGAAVLEIAYSAGFNSNSAFYAAFKRRVGMTPAEFRRSLDRQS